MDLTDSGTTVSLITAVVLLAGILGVVIPVLPGLLLCWLAVLFWALLGDAGTGRWVVLALATVVAAGGTVVKYLWPGKRLKSTGVPTSSMLAGGVLGVVGFFVVPVVGLVLGFILGLWLAERVRLGPGQAWPSTREALGAVGLSLLVEFAAALAVAVIWVFGLLAT
ncbi:DUF456 domain-containing protein [Actinoplanes friuliensis]|uniref:DUF456 domain-containing protein n=1 Tax=Actinoplanes friuliensis DSM 7358 TaxID=1246995 RepID=U5W683_9ACTN|nr:DUF456 domain-containing protein [Actinoplanes friuliensis]AGZ44629.1 hypothetical protein AFR_31845 [Actinoplanes friuliensis DSM 7358]